MAIELVDGESEKRQREVIDALTLAFARDPIMRWFYPEPNAYLRHFPRFIGAFGGVAFGAGTAWASEDGGGAALWLPSGVHADGEKIGSIAFETVDEAKHEAMGTMFEKMAEFHPEEPHWYLAVIGVDAAYQGKGIGAELMQGALERCDEEGLMAYLESSNPANISLYQRHGFQVVDEIQIDDVPVVTPMMRPAR
jgi:ribosomal protein S18 acetylase RimI-like enzyme